MTRRLAALATVLAVACAAGVQARPARSVEPATAQDIELLLSELERIHPNPYHATSRAEYRAAADALIARLPALDADQFLVEVLRIVALLGERDGHAYVSLLDGDRVHFYPLRVYDFSDGAHVVATAGRPELVGLKLVAIEGRPLAEVLALVRPLTTHDNELSLKGQTMLPLAAAEVLHGLGVAPSAERATFTFESATGERRDVELTPLGADAYVRGLRAAYPTWLIGLPKRSRPLFVTHRGAVWWLTTLERGRVVYFSYNQVIEDTSAVARRILRLARQPKVRRVVVDLRNNGGGEIRTYRPLLRALRNRAVDRPNRLVLLIGRTTFSAAVHFATDVERSTGAILVGEPTGGSPNHYSDADEFVLPVSGWRIGIPTVRYEKLPGRSGLTLEPDVPVDLTAADFFAGRDPVLDAALGLR